MLVLSRSNRRNSSIHSRARYVARAAKTRGALLAAGQCILGSFPNRVCQWQETSGSITAVFGCPPFQDSRLANRS